MLNWERIDEKIVKKLKAYCEELIEINQDNLVSINLVKEFECQKDIGYSFKLIVVCKEVKISLLKNNLKLIKKGNKEGILAPLFFTLRHIESSSDVFPIEFSTMKSRYQIIWGEDVFANIKIDYKNLRLQCEQEIKGKLIRLRQVYLEIGLQEKEIKRLIYTSFQSFIPVLKIMLEIKKTDVSFNTLDIINSFSDMYKVDMSLFKKIYQIKIDKFKKIELEDFFEQYVNLIYDIAGLADQLEV
jgi:hypothetical protein